MTDITPAEAGAIARAIATAFRNNDETALNIALDAAEDNHDAVHIHLAAIAAHTLNTWAYIRPIDPDRTWQWLMADLTRRHDPNDPHYGTVPPGGTPDRTE